ncbi:hypothetical protein [Aureibacter tunicatorum]|uniref:Uncharacterized protein n=1 Tax=Aureibacter tunicatorum TaxID=866807 RepID=A0AAE3XN27_9BACT|nr:hypothetical protein [Aureibacter tunicatorum]MDR6240951.1 hypothetical protein [Aureibacter tunicatorum]BDD03731.1 hypothetical protein AUTU_12140 [Aureibacter tunicatorum]
MAYSTNSNQNNSFNSFFKANMNQWDKLNSTYCWKIYQVGNHRVLSGYSKGKNISERVDKDTLLQAKIEMLYKKGYFIDKQVGKRSALDRIEFFYNKIGDLGEPFLTMYYDHYELSPSEIDNRNLINFLERFTALRSGEDVQNLVKKSRKSTEDLLSLSKHRFLDENQLHKHCLYLLDSLHIPKGRIEDFYRKYRAKYFKEIDNKSTVKEVEVPKDELAQKVSRMKNRYLQKLGKDHVQLYIKDIKAQGNMFMKATLERFEKGIYSDKFDRSLYATFLIERYGSNDDKQMLRAFKSQ